MNVSAILALLSVFILYITEGELLLLAGIWLSLDALLDHFHCHQLTVITGDGDGEDSI